MSAKTDDELISELQTLIKTIPNLDPKLQGLKELDEEENKQINSNELEDSKNRIIN